MNSKKEILIEVVSAAFVLLFVYAALTKLIDYQKFRLQLGQSPVLTRFAGILVWLVPSVEIVIALMLMKVRLRLMGLYASFALMVMFTAYIVVITRYSDYIPCSCGGVLEKLSWDEHLIFNLCFVALSSVAIMIYPKDILLQWKQGNAENLE